MSEDVIKVIARKNPGNFEIKDKDNLFVTDHVIRSDSSSTQNEKLLCMALQPFTNYQDKDNIAIAKEFISNVMGNISDYHNTKWKQHGVVELASNLKDDDDLTQQFCDLIEKADIEDVKKLKDFTNRTRQSFFDKCHPKVKEAIQNEGENIGMLDAREMEMKSSSEAQVVEVSGGDSAVKQSSEDPAVKFSSEPVVVEVSSEKPVIEKSSEPEA